MLDVMVGLGRLNLTRKVSSDQIARRHSLVQVVPM
jgi:hypothetical protein